MKANLTPKQQSEVMALIRKKHEQERVIWELKDKALNLLDEIDELKREKLEYGQIAKMYGINTNSVYYMLYRNKR